MIQKRRLTVYDNERNSKTIGGGKPTLIMLTFWAGGTVSKSHQKKQAKDRTSFPFGELRSASTFTNWFPWLVREGTVVVRVGMHGSRDASANQLGEKGRAVEGGADQ